MSSNTDLTAYLAEHGETEKASFHMPGHKGREFFTRLGYSDWLSGIADHDITEIPGADDLRHPEGIIKTLTDKYAALYGSDRALISVNGSSALIMAAIMTGVTPGHKIIAAADSHISVRNGATLAGAGLVYVKTHVIDPWENDGTDPGPDVVEQSVEGCGLSGTELLSAPGSLVNQGTSPNGDAFGVPAGLSAASVAKALDENLDADAVILPSPNYFGIVSDIKAIADEVHKRGKILIVDQAHGAHLKMFADAGQAVSSAGQTETVTKNSNTPGCDDKWNYSGIMPLPAEECGADIVIVSTHKTLASFTQTAVASIFGDRVDPDGYEKKLLMLESTSPSYILMESLAVNADIMEKHGSELAGSWREDLDWFYENVKSIPVIRVLTRNAVQREARACRDLQPAGSGCAENGAAAGIDAGANGAAAGRYAGAGGIDFDDSKIVIDFSGTGLTGEEAEEILIEKGIYPEFSTGSVVMFLTGIGNKREDYELLLEALSEIAWRDPFSDKE